MTTPDTGSPHDAISIGNTPGYEPVCMVKGPGCQGRAVAICWECVVLTCFTCAVDHASSRTMRTPCGRRRRLID